MLTDGMYRTRNGDIFKVQTSKTSGHLYAKHLRPISGERLTEADTRIRFEFVYAPGAVQALTEDMRMSLDEAREFGIRTGTCCVCGAFLKDATSVANGIGPVCAKRQAWRAAA